MKRKTIGDGLFFTSKIALASLLIIACLAWVISKPAKPTLYLIGDSTVDNGQGGKGLWGWGKYLPRFFDTTRINILNYGQGGTSARTFQTNGIWDKNINKRGMWDTVYAYIHTADYLIIQFGLNDQGPIADSSRARGTLRGIGNDSVVINNVLTHKAEVVHSFGWYMRNFIRQAKKKGAEVIVCSTVPKNVWQGGKLVRGEEGFANWAMQVADEEHVNKIDLNTLIADQYDKEGEEAVTNKYHIKEDKVHTVESGAILNARLVAEGIKQLNTCRLKEFLTY